VTIPLDVIRSYGRDTIGHWSTNIDADTAEFDAAMEAVEQLVRASRDVSRTEATGVLPDFQPLADALAIIEGRG
jgi:hypothetical protein